MKWIETQINGTAVRIAFDADSIHIFDAYPIKDDLKREGFRWNPEDKSWMLRAADAQAVLTRLSCPGIPEAEPIADGTPQKVQGDEAERSIGVAQLRERIESQLRRSMPETLWVRGLVVSEVKQYRWAAYFDLGDEGNDSAFFFRVEVPGERLAVIEKALADLGVAQRLEKDLPVMLQVSLSLSSRYAVDVRLTVRDIVAEYTQSKLRNLREITLDRLRREGIADRQRQLTLPMLIDRIGLISSSQGTSIQDIRTAMAPYQKRYHILFCDARMEGGMAVTSIVSALRRLQGLNDPPQLIVLARGGGSEQSLAVFNDYRICREICLSPIPVLAAIGHEKDLSAAEICAHVTPSPSTPSGAGKFLARRYEHLLESLRKLVNVWLVLGRRQVDGERRSLQTRLGQLPLLGTRRIQQAMAGLMQQIRYADVGRQTARIRERGKNVSAVVKNLFFSGRRVLALAGERLKVQGDIAAAHSPQRILGRGFTLLFDDDGRVIGRRETFLGKRRGTLRFQDGDARIKSGEDSD